MNLETARILARAIKTRDTAAKALYWPYTSPEATVSLASTYVHEQRIINKIITEDVDE